MFSSIVEMMIIQWFKWWLMCSGTQWAGGCKTSTTSAPMTLRSLLSSAVTSIHQRRGGKEWNMRTNRYLLLATCKTWKHQTPNTWHLICSTFIAILAITKTLLLIPQLGGRVVGQQGLPDGVHVGRAQRSQGHGKLPYLPTTAPMLSRPWHIWEEKALEM